MFRDADEGLQVESDAEDEADQLKLGKKKKKAQDMNDQERRHVRAVNAVTSFWTIAVSELTMECARLQAALDYFQEKCKRSFPDTREVSSEDLLVRLSAPCCC